MPILDLNYLIINWVHSQCMKRTWNQLNVHFRTPFVYGRWWKNSTTEVHFGQTQKRFVQTEAKNDNIRSSCLLTAVQQSHTWIYLVYSCQIMQWQGCKVPKMHPARKKSLAYFVIGVFFLLGGVEYGEWLRVLWVYTVDRLKPPPPVAGMAARCELRHRHDFKKKIPTKYTPCVFVSSWFNQN